MAALRPTKPAPMTRIFSGITRVEEMKGSKVDGKDATTVINGGIIER